MHSERRELVYDLKEKGKTDGITIRGRKRLAYDLKSDDICTTLITLPTTMTLDSEHFDLEFSVDTLDMTKGASPFQITNKASLPNMLMGLVGTGAFLVRAIIQTQFWNLGALDYKRYPSRKETEHNPERMAIPPSFFEYSRKSSGKRYTYTSTLREDHKRYDTKGTMISRLVRYQPQENEIDAPAEARKTILLIHGLAHSGRIFWTDTIDVNMTQYFLSQNYDVWILDHRTSASIMLHVDPENTWDEIAREDVVWAVETVYDAINRPIQDVPQSSASRSGDQNGEQPGARGETRKKKVHIFSHCIGAGAVAIAALSGLLVKQNNKENLSDDKETPAETHTGTHGKNDVKDHEEEGMVASLVPHAVTPWLVASKENRLRENVWGLFKNRTPIDIVEPRPYEDPSQIEILFDRIASSTISKNLLPQLSGFKWNLRSMPGFARGIYMRYTIFWGKQWHTQNIDPRTMNQFSGMIGAVPQAILQQLYFSITKGRISSHDGLNEYVNEKGLKNWNFPTLFLHGTRNEVFDIESSRLSARYLTAQKRRSEKDQLAENEDLFNPLNKCNINEYRKHDVDIAIFEEYGHMDMVFGKNAHSEIFPALDRFYTAAEELVKHNDHVKINDGDDLSNRKTLQDFLATPRTTQENSLSQSILLHKPQDKVLAGPILTIKDDLPGEEKNSSAKTLRFLIEEDDFATQFITGFKAEPTNETGDKGEPIDVEENEPEEVIKQREKTHVSFRLYDFSKFPEGDFSSVDIEKQYYIQKDNEEKNREGK